MDTDRFDALTRGLITGSSRRGLLHTLLGSAVAIAGVAGVGSPGADAKKQKKKKKKKCKGCCRGDGSPCTKKSSKCKAEFCLNAPFTIEANWVVDADHDAVLFVPPENEETGPFPFIFFDCTAADSTCETGYPFACMSGDETTSGSEIATIFQLLPGTYEYWNELDVALAGELTIVLKDNGGRVMREWTNPANPDNDNGWHVFDIDGATGRITTIDELIDGGVPQGAHDPSTEVCPFEA
jgi:hypothetical protein